MQTFDLAFYKPRISLGIGLPPRAFRSVLFGKNTEFGSRIRGIAMRRQSGDRKAAGSHSR